MFFPLRLPNRNINAKTNTMQIDKSILKIWNSSLKRGDVARIAKLFQAKGMSLTRQAISNAISTGRTSEKNAEIINEFFIAKKRGDLPENKLNAKMKESLIA